LPSKEGKGGAACGQLDRQPEHGEDAAPDHTADADGRHGPESDLSVFIFQTCRFLTVIFSALHERAERISAFFILKSIIVNENTESLKQRKRGF
jgi:hypothetical protein